MKLFKFYLEEKYLGLTRVIPCLPEIRPTSPVPDCLPEIGNNFKNPYLLIYLSKNYDLHIKLKALHLYFNTVKFYNFWIRFDLWISLHNTTASSETNQTALLWTSINSRFAYKFPKIMNTHIPTQFSLLNPMEPSEFQNSSSTMGEQ